MQEPIKISLVGEQTHIQPGQTFRVAIIQDIQKGFHTYYKNPGKLGLATNIKWDLPEGFKAGPIIWPVPQETIMSAYTVWGYENSAMLVNEIVAPKKLPIGQEFEIKARVTYMCCSSTCHPGASDASLKLKLSKDRVINTKWMNHFSKFDREQPKPSKNWAMSCYKKENHYVFELTYLRNSSLPTLDNLKLYTDERIIDSNQPIRVIRLESGYRLIAKTEKFVGTPPSVFHGILTSNSDIEKNNKAIKVNSPIFTDNNINSNIPKISTK